MDLVGHFLTPNGTEVYYGRQLEVLLEKTYFHWITKRALNELAQDGTIKTSIERVRQFDVHFYWPRRHRYPRRQIGAIKSLIKEFSDPQFTHALGEVGETLFDGGMARIGFRIVASKVRSFNSKEWVQTNHDLDRVVTRDGHFYGVEIKNTLGYIDRDELDIKIAMNEHFGTTPFFVARNWPKTYMFRLYSKGGFGLMLDNQHYPQLTDDLARRVRQRLQLPVLRIRELTDTTMQRFERWHMNRIAPTPM